MFRLHRREKSVIKSREKIGFKFSNFQAIHVPKGWDSLLVSIVSLETGKTTAKSSKASVRNGSCQWPETLSESIWISQDDSSKELDECLFKFVVSMGSARSGILGEIIINMTDYMKSRTSAPVTFPLKKCSHGTTLQVKVQCLTPRSNLRANISKDSNSASEDLDAECPQMDAQSDGSDTTYVNSHTSATSKDMGSTAHPRELGSRETSISASSHHSSDSTGSPKNNLNGDLYNPSGRQDSSGARHSAPNDSYSVDDPSRLNHFSFNTRITGSENNSLNATSSLRNDESSRNLLEAAEYTIEEIRAEAKMWEKNARKLMVDLEIIKKEFSDQSKKQADMEMELLAANTEIDGLKKEVEQLKVSLEESWLNQTLNEEPTFQAKGGSQYRQELEEEIKFQKDTNDSLSLQLTRSQESNIELVSVLKELEETIETQKSEIEKISTLEAKFTDMENNIQEQMETNKILTLELQQKKESEMDFLANIRCLEKSLEEKSNKLKNEWHLNQERRLQDEELAGLEAKSSYANLVGEMEALKEKVQELEKDCNELTDENLELILKIKYLESNSSKYLSSTESEVSDCKSQIYHPEEDIKKKNNEDQLDSSEVSRVLFELFDQLEIAFALIRKPWYNISSPYDIKSVIGDRIKSDGLDIVGKKEHAEGILNSIVELNKVLDARIVACEKALKSGEADVNEMSKQIAEGKKELEGYISKANGSALSAQELESMKIELEAKFDDQGKVMNEQKNEIVKMEADMLSKEKEIMVLRKCQSVFERQISDLSSSVDSHVSAKNVLERKSSELERKKDELELHLSELEQQNILLSEHRASLEAQLKHTKDEKEAERLELDNAKSLATSLQDQIVQSGVELETQRVDLNQKLQDIQNQWLEAQQECENLEMENSNLIARTDSLAKSSEELRKENLELNLHYTQLKSELNESREAFCNCSKRVVLLEENISALVQNYAGKEKALNSEINGLSTENNSLNQLYQDKKVEVETLQQEVEHLNQQLSSFKDDGEKVVSNAVHEAIFLRESNAKLESVLLEVQSQLKQTEDELNLVQTESEIKVQSMITELAALQQNHDTLKAANGKMSKLLLKYESTEDRKKSTENDLELKVTVAEYERQRLLEETARLKVKLQKVNHLPDEIMALTNALNAMKIENEKLGVSLSIISGDCDELKAENILFFEKISSLQKDVLEIEDFKQSRIALEEKFQRMEGELAEKSVLCTQEAELKNELSKMKSANRQLQWKVQELEEEKSECGKRAQTLEDEINFLKVAKKDRNELNGKNIPVHEGTRRSKADNGYDLHSGSSRANEVDHLLKIQLLENELAEALETNNFYKNQLNRVLPESRNNHEDNSRKSKSEGEIVPKERFERTKSSLQAELRELRDRYLDMSLKYAEVESQREELVMKLKNSTSGKRLGFF